MLKNGTFFGLEKAMLSYMYLEIKDKHIKSG